jgi:L-asparaginase/Glu-tRNA(Gln) amidotransferase subunit D
METTAILVSMFVAIALPIILSGKQWKAEEDKARAPHG